MREALETWWANPSSVHRSGQEARRVLELARAEMAELLSVRPREITFTSGGTESIDLALRGSLAAARRAGDEVRPLLVTTKVEHAAVRDLAELLAQRDGVETRWWPVDDQGVLRVDQIDSMLAASGTTAGPPALVSIQWANNETGAIQPVHQIGRACRARGARLHVDATQWVGKMPVVAPGLPPLDEWCDLLTCAPHKFGGPKGVGVLWARAGVGLVPVQPGTQEKGRRGGTENVPAIVGAGVAARLARLWLADPAQRERLAALRDRFERMLLEAFPLARVNGPVGPAARLWNTTNIAFPALEAEPLLLAMSERGVAASAGAACSSGSLDPSPVLLAMGVPPALAHGSLRFSIGPATTSNELDQAAAVVIESVRRVGGAMLGWAS